MICVANFNIVTTRDRTIGINQIDGIQQLPAIIALVPARALKLAIGACPLDIAVREVASIRDRIDLFRGSLF